MQPPGFQWSIATFIGFGFPKTEGLNLGVAEQELGEATFDVFFRLLLTHLMLYRSMVDHPGYNWGKHCPQGMMKITYLTTLTNETDPAKRDKKLQEYAQRMMEEMAKSPVPEDWPGDVTDD